MHHTSALQPTRLLLLLPWEPVHLLALLNFIWTTSKACEAVRVLTNTTYAQNMGAGTNCLGGTMAA